jgi:hypothetical protein
MEKIVRCCICQELVHFLKSHNPWPINTKPESRCCGDCNYEVVIPRRIQQMSSGV